MNYSGNVSCIANVLFKMVVGFVRYQEKIHYCHFGSTVGEIKCGVLKLMVLLRFILADDLAYGL